LASLSSGMTNILKDLLGLAGSDIYPFLLKKNCYWSLMSAGSILLHLYA
jgi:hypothetical protein